MDREFCVKVTEGRGDYVSAHITQYRAAGDRNPQHVLGEMLGDVIVSMAADDAANVLQALIQRLNVLDDESLRPFGKLALLWRVWQTRGGDAEFCEFAKVEEDQ